MDRSDQSPEFHTGHKNHPQLTYYNKLYLGLKVCMNSRCCLYILSPSESLRKHVLSVKCKNNRKTSVINVSERTFFHLPIDSPTFDIHRL